jgi:hypothetical protein
MTSRETVAGVSCYECFHLVAQAEFRTPKRCDEPIFGGTEDSLDAACSLRGDVASVVVGTLVRFQPVEPRCSF